LHSRHGNLPQTEILRNCLPRITQSPGKRV
jgi:hypothetical protein